MVVAVRPGKRAGRGARENKLYSLAGAIPGLNLSAGAWPLMRFTCRYICNGLFCRPRARRKGDIQDVDDSIGFYLHGIYM